MSDLIPALPQLIGGFMIIFGIGMAVLFIALAIGDDNE